MTDQTTYPKWLYLNEVRERSYLFDCRISRLTSNPILKFNCLVREDGKDVPHYTDSHLD